jgi:purine-binding chemotaxis protein CheW
VSPTTNQKDPRRDARADDVVKLAAFRLADQEYAVDIMKIKEIVNPIPITRVPKAPPFIEGMIELRGSILPIVDLRKRFELPAPAFTRATKYVNALFGEQVVGLVVDSVSEVLRVPRSQIRPAPALVEGDGSRYILGVYRRDQRIFLILDLDRILSSHEKLGLESLRPALLADGPAGEPGAGRGGAT